jgi:hypothetical protein
MRLVIPERLGRIAPVFDWCRRIVIVFQARHGADLIGYEDWTTLPRHRRPGRLRDLVVELVICGGISHWMEDQIHEHQITTISWVSGDVWEILTALRERRILDPRYAMPGRRGCARLCRARRRSGATDSRKKAGKGVHKCLDLIEEDHWDKAVAQEDVGAIASPEQSLMGLQRLTRREE